MRMLLLFYYRPGTTTFWSKFNLKGKFRFKCRTYHIKLSRVISRKEHDLRCRIDLPSKLQDDPEDEYKHNIMDTNSNVPLT